MAILLDMRLVGLAHMNTWYGAFFLFDMLYQDGSTVLLTPTLYQLSKLLIKISNLLLFVAFLIIFTIRNFL